MIFLFYSFVCYSCIVWDRDRLQLLMFRKLRSEINHLLFHAIQVNITLSRPVQVNHQVKCKCSH